VRSPELSDDEGESKPNVFANTSLESNQRAIRLSENYTREETCLGENNYEEGRHIQSSGAFFGNSNDCIKTSGSHQPPLLSGTARNHDPDKIVEEEDSEIVNQNDS